MTNQTPKAFDFDEEPMPPTAPAASPPGSPVTPKPFDFGDAEVSPLAPPTAPPRALSFDDLPNTPAGTIGLAKTAPKPLFDSEDHPAVRDALAMAHTDYPVLFAHSEQRLAALFRRILPVKLSLVTTWAEEPLMEQATVLRPVINLVRRFSQLAAPALLEEALESTKAPSGVLGKLFGRTMTPSHFKPGLISARTRLQQFMVESETATRNLDESAKNLTLHWVVLAVVSELAARDHDATLLDVLLQRRTLIQQAVRQAEMSVLQMGQVRQQAADLIGQVTSFLTVTLPALEMAQAQGRPE